jgi:hypothetical protein
MRYASSKGRLRQVFGEGTVAIGVKPAECAINAGLRCWSFEQCRGVTLFSNADFS